MKYSIQEILESFNEPGNARAVSITLSDDGLFIKSVTFECDRDDCNCCGGWTTAIGQTVATQMRYAAGNEGILPRTCAGQT